MTPEVQLSDREREILQLVAMGATNQQIAHQLDISINTVKVHLRNIFGKIGVASRTEATVYAIRQGFVVVDGRQGSEAPTPLSEAPMEAPVDVPAAVDAAREEAPAQAPLPAPAPPPPTPAEERAPAEALPRPASRPRARLPLVVTLATAAALGTAGAVYWLRPVQPATPPAPTQAAAVAMAGRWRARADLARPRADFAVTPFDGRLYVLGGQHDGGASASVDRYDPANDVWVALTDKPTAVSHVEAAAIGRLIYVPGGETSDGHVLDVLEAYDPRSQEWQTLPALPAPRSRYALASYEGRLYLFGGWDGSNYADDVFVYDPAERAWMVDDQPLPTARRGAAAAVVEGRIYVIGGEGEGGALRAHERYDPTGDSGRRWESVAPLAVPVVAPAAVGIVNTALVFDEARQVAAQYTPATDSWVSVAIPADVKVSSRAAFLGTSVYVFGRAASGAPGSLSEYQALYNTFLPSTTGNQ